MAMPRISTVTHALAIRRVEKKAGADVDTMLEALGLAAYDGHDTTTMNGTGRGKKRPARRVPELYDEEEERERVKFLGSTNGPRELFTGFNRYDSIRSPK